MDAKVTISRRSSQVGEGVISIEITDRNSSLIAASVTLTFEDFAQCITGVGAMPANWQFPPTAFTAENIGKNRETKTVSLQWCKYGGEREELERLIEPHLTDGWQLFDDGMTRQQKTPNHTVYLYRFVEAQ